MSLYLSICHHPLQHHLFWCDSFLSPLYFSFHDPSLQRVSSQSLHFSLCLSACVLAIGMFSYPIVPIILSFCFMFRSTCFSFPLSCFHLNESANFPSAIFPI